MQLYFLFFGCISAELIGGRNSTVNNDRNIFFFPLFGKKQKWFEKYLWVCQKPAWVRKVHGKEAVPVTQGNCSTPWEGERLIPVARLKIADARLCVHMRVRVRRREKGGCWEAQRLCSLTSSWKNPWTTGRGVSLHPGPAR